MRLEGQRGNPSRVVVVSEEILSRLRSSPGLLRRSNVRFLLAYSGSEVLSLARASDPSLILIDYALPVLRADEVCREIKASLKLRDIPVAIAGPAYPPEFEAASHEAGCEAYFATPLDVAALSSWVARLLGERVRQESRLSVLLSVNYGAIVSQSLGCSRDLSLAGIQVRSSTKLQEGFCVSVRFSLDASPPIATLGRVVRVIPTEEGDYDMGIRFIGLPAEARTRLEEFLETRRA